MTVDPVEVTDGDGWKVNFGLEAHNRYVYWVRSKGTLKLTIEYG